MFGAEGSLPGGFKYKAEFNFAQGKVDYEDITLSYDFKDSPLTVTIVNFYPYSSLETVTSSRLGSMLERASFTDAFNYNRRLGIGLSLADKTADKYTLAAGVFSTRPKSSADAGVLICKIGGGPPLRVVVKPSATATVTVNAYSRPTWSALASSAADTVTGSLCMTTARMIALRPVHIGRRSKGRARRRGRNWRPRHAIASARF